MKNNLPFELFQKAFRWTDHSDLGNWTEKEDGPIIYWLDESYANTNLSNAFSYQIESDFRYMEQTQGKVANQELWNALAKGTGVGKRICFVHSIAWDCSVKADTFHCNGKLLTEDYSAGYIFKCETLIINYTVIIIIIIDYIL